MENNKENNFVSAVVYCHDDAPTLVCFVENLDKTLSNHFLKYEIIIVNDGSIDDSVNYLRQYASKKEEKNITLLNMSHYQGIEASMNAGVDLSIGDFVYEFDQAYVDFDWEMVMNIYHQSLKGYDIVSARANQPSRLSSRLFYAIFNRYANLQYAIGTESFRILSRRAINRIHSISQSIPFRKAAYANCGLSVSQITYTSTETTKRKLHSDRTSVALDSIILFTDVAYRITVGLAIIMALATTTIAFYALIYKIMSNPVEGWATTVIFMAFGFTGLFIILAMVIKYLQMLVKLSFRKKDYLFESIEKLQ